MEMGQKVNLVGHSWGAMLASAYLGQYPEKVDHAVLAEPGFLTSEFRRRVGRGDPNALESPGSFFIL